MSTQQLSETQPTQGDSNSQQENDQEPLPPRVPRRISVACTFCRGRKLRCDGGRPSCANCDRRSFPCEYVPVPK